MKKNVKLQEAIAAKKKANELEDETENTLDIGDTIPHITELDLEKQYEMCKYLREIHDVLKHGVTKVKKSEAILPQSRPQGIFSDRSILRVLLAAAELFGLFGHQKDRRNVLVLMCDVATRLGVPEFYHLAAGDLLKMEAGQLSTSNLGKMLKWAKLNPDSLESFHVPLGVSYMSFYNGDVKMAEAYASDLLAILPKAKPSSTIPYLDRMISSELNLLLSKCRGAPGSHVVLGATSKVEQNGPLDFALWAYKDTYLARSRLDQQCPDAQLSMNSIHIRARSERLYFDSLRELLSIYRQRMLGREMRLYAKIKLELSQCAGLPFRYKTKLTAKYDDDKKCGKNIIHFISGLLRVC